MKTEHNFKMKFDDSIYISVFNINDKEIDRALKAYKIIYGIKKFNELQKIIQAGIMAMFDINPITDELVMFVLLLTQIQNQKK